MRKRTLLQNNQCPTASICPNRLPNVIKFIRKETAVKIKQTAAILSTAAATIACGFPGLALMCLGNLTILTTQEAGIPSHLAISDLVMSAIYLAAGLTLFLVPVAVGLVSFYLAGVQEITSTESNR
jgi:hypothetical protein